MSFTPKRVLVVNPYGIGDVLFMTPLLKVLKNQPGINRVDVLLGSRTDTVLKNNPHVDYIYFLDKGALSRLSFLKRIQTLFSFYKVLAENRYDTFIDLSLTREYAFFAKFILRCRQRVGFNYKGRGAFLNLRQELPEGFADKKVPEYYAGLLSLIGIPVPKELKLDFHVSEPARVAIQKKLSVLGLSPRSRFVAVSCGGGESWGKDAVMKQWPPRSFKELLEKLRAIYPLDAVVFIGGPKDAALNEEASRGLSLPSHHFAGKLSLEESAALLTFSRFALLNEGGLYHLASSQGVPAVVIVGPVDEKVYGSVSPGNELLVFKEDLECRPCYRRFRYHSECEKRECLQGLTPDEVLGRIVQSGFLQHLSN